MYGITFLQVFMYFTEKASAKDGLFLKAFIVALWYVRHAIAQSACPDRPLRALDTTHLALTAHALYYYTISEFTNILALTHVRLYCPLTWCLLMIPLTGRMV
jgi:hypothetical protein